MQGWLETFTKCCDIMLAILIGILAWWFLEPDFLKGTSVELMAFFSLQAAIVMPALILSVTILRHDEMNLRYFDLYHTAIRNQMHSWIWLMAVCYIVVAIILASKLTNWSYSWLSSILITLCVIVITRIIYFVRGILSLFDIRRNLAKDIVKNRISNEQEQRRQQSTPLELPSGYGERVENGG